MEHDAALRSIPWWRLYRHGHDSMTLVARSDGVRFYGSAQFARDGMPCEIDYEVRCDAATRYRFASGGGTFTTEIEVDEDGLVVHYPGFWDRWASR